MHRYMQVYCIHNIIIDCMEQVYVYSCVNVCMNVVHVAYLFGGPSNDGKLSSWEIVDTGGIKTKATVFAYL